MLSLKAKIRNKFGRKTNFLRKEGVLPAVLYGEKLKNLSLEIEEKEFEKVFQEAGESSLISLEILDPSGRTRVEGKSPKKVQVLIHDTAQDPITDKFLHVDFYHPSAKKEIEVEIPLVFEGTAAAVKELDGTLVREIQQVEVKGLAQNLPREIKVNIEVLKTFEDKIRIKDLDVPQDVTILRGPKEIVANVVPPREEEEEVPKEEEKPVEEEGKVEEEEEKKREGKVEEGEKKKEEK